MSRDVAASPAASHAFATVGGPWYRAADCRKASSGWGMAGDEMRSTIPLDDLVLNRGPEVHDIGHDISPDITTELGLDH